jgi:tetratricopeptide (TPR) repeat protein/S1-C subfamily serine protease
MKYPLLFGSLGLILIATPVMAKSGDEIQQVARSTAVEIKVVNSNEVGSGVLIRKQGDVYTLATNRHVVCGVARSKCTKVSPSATYTLVTADGIKHQIKAAAIQLLPDELDLSLVQFHSSKNYPVAPLANSNQLQNGEVVYASGFPYANPQFHFRSGGAVAVVHKRLTGDNGGYTIIHSAYTQPGMSGGGIFNTAGQVVAIHGLGDRFKEGTETLDDYRVGRKIGYNRAIPINMLVQGAKKIGSNLGDSAKPTLRERPASSTSSTSADEFFIKGFNKHIDPGSNVTAGKLASIQDFSQAIRLNPKYISAYFLRAITYSQIGKFKESIADDDQVIALNPQFASAYANRGLSKNRLKDFTGAMSDYNQAISIAPNNPSGYNNRASLKADSLQDLLGAIADLNRSLALDPTEAEIYNSRGILKKKTNDFAGSLADYNQAIKLNPRYYQAYFNRAILKINHVGDGQGALADLNMAAEINQTNASIFYNRGLLKRKLNDNIGAVADYDRAIAIEPSSDIYNNRGFVKYAKLNDVAGALQDYNRAIALDAQNGIAYYNRAVLKRDRQKDKVGAIADLRQALEIFRKEGNTKAVKVMIEDLQALGVSNP